MGELDGGESSKLRGRIVVTGSSTVAPLMQQIASQFEENNRGVRVDVQTGGSSRGIRDAKTGAADIGMSSRALKPNESEAVETQIVAWDGVAFVVHGDNPVEGLSIQQLRDIYLGQIESWADVGGDVGKIVVSNRANGRSELDLVCEYLKLRPEQIKADVIDGETQQSLKTVINNKKAITYTSIGAAQDAIDRGENIRLLPLGEVVASADTVQSGEFPLARPLVLITKSSSSNDSKARLIKTFLEFALSEDVSQKVSGLGFVGSKSRNTPQLN